MTKYKHKDTGEEVTLLRVLPVYNGQGIDHYVFKRINGKELILPIGEVKRDWEIVVPLQ